MSLFNRIKKGFLELNQAQLLHGQIVFNIVILIGFVGAFVYCFINHSVWYWFAVFGGVVGVQSITLIGLVKQYKAACAAIDMIALQQASVRELIKTMEDERNEDIKG